MKFITNSKLIVAAFFIFISVLAYFGLGLIIKPAEGWHQRVTPAKKFIQLDQNIVGIGSSPEITADQYTKVFKYFVEGIASYRRADSSQVLYPGVPGTRGIKVEGLEGFARTAPFLASWIASGRSNYIKLENNQEFNIRQHLIDGISAGTTPDSANYWGVINDFDQRTVEAADVALTIWLIKDELSKELTETQLNRVKLWLKGVNSVKIYGGNWYLFKVVVNSVLTALGDESALELAQKNLKEFKRFYIGDGWFTDGDGGKIDYYNAWQMQYFLYWADRITPNLDHAFIKNTIVDFNQSYKYFISTQGVPIMGRSACYRLAVSAPLIAQSLLVNTKENNDLARRALDVTWSFFIEHASLKKGSVTQGYCNDTPELLENYSGRGSCLWSLRSLILAFQHKKQDHFWVKNDGKLPVELDSFDITIAGPKLRLTGNVDTSEIVLYQQQTQDYLVDINEHGLIEMPWWRKVAEYLLRRPLRLENFDVKYRRKKYSSKEPFCDCET